MLDGGNAFDADGKARQVHRRTAGMGKVFGRLQVARNRSTRGGWI